MIPRVKPEGMLFGKPDSTHRVKARGQAFPDHARDTPSSSFCLARTPDRRSNLRNPIQLSRIIFQIVDGNMIVSVTLHGLENHPQGDGYGILRAEF